AAYPGAVPEPEPTLTAPPEAVVPTWGLGDAAVGWVLGLVGGLLTQFLAFGLSGTPLDQPDDLPLAWVAVAQVGLWAGLLGVPYAAARLKGNGLRRDFGLTAKLSDLPLGVLCGIVGQTLIIWVVYLPLQWLTDVSAEDISEPAQNLTDRAHGTVGVVLLVLIVGIGAPVVEEIFYRGLLQRSLIRRFGPVWGIAGASVLFGAAHLQPLQFPALVLAGALFGMLAHRYGRLGPSIAAHVVFNMTAVVALLAGA
ncbi:MAG TPA: CPBP family intramembrane glutamic endopeptidase, partial [Acidimicrobiales bacterium]|nr:CPBP family intramembrane glutamic endopeptidase [Acidimicrobiales bacterium]